MDNHSIDERNSSTGNSGMLGLSSFKSNLQPIRIKAFLDMYASDEEDSEDKGKDSNSDSECDDVQSLPEDIQEKPEKSLSTVMEESSAALCFDSNKKNIGQIPCIQEIPFEQPLRSSIMGTSVKPQENIDVRVSRQFTDNFPVDEDSQRRSEIQGPANICSEFEAMSTLNAGSSALKPITLINRRSNVKLEIPDTCKSSNVIPAISSKTDTTDSSAPTPETLSSDVKFESHDSVYFTKDSHLHPTNVTHSEAMSTVNAGCSALKALTLINRRSNVKFEIPDTCKSSNVIPAISSKTDTTASSAPTPETLSSDVKFESHDLAYFTKDSHLHPTNVTHSEPISSSLSTLQPPLTPGSHLITDTPLKNNPPVGSMRPTPSISHRSMFQTPQSSKFHHDYGKNHVQTPVTIFGNCTKNQMAQTPRQNCLTTNDSVRSQGSSIVPQYSSGHAMSLYRSNDEKRVRRPLAETIQSDQHRHNDKLAAQYNTETSLSSATNNETHNRGIMEIVSDKCSNKANMQHDYKENRHPQPNEKPLINEEPLRRRVSKSINEIKESISISAKETANEILLKAKIGNIESHEHPQSVHLNNLVPAAVQILEKKNVQERQNNVQERQNNVQERQNNVQERQNNVQVSIPSRIRCSNQGQTITVKSKDYLVLGTLGEGMSGQVLRVQDIKSLELRAIKIVDLSRMDKDCAQGCLQEISMLHKLQAPCIVKIFDHEIKYPMVHVILEMGDTDFKSLLNSMLENNRLPLTMILYYWTEMLTAVKHIHDNGVIHSDLKPANFLLVRGRLKLIDFGIASSMNADMTSVFKNNPIGTLNYISPEALMDISGNGGESPNCKLKYKISYKSDVWSLGCILYSLVYGYTPFHNIRNQWGKVSAITNPHPKISFAMPTGSDGESMPSILIDVMRKCLQHDPKARPTVAQLLQISYIPDKQISSNTVPDLPSNILTKIKYSLTDSEWRQFTEIMEARRNQC